MEEIRRLADVALGPTVERAVESARELLDMDVAYATTFTRTDQIFRVLDGDGESFGVHQGIEIPHEKTYCRRILAGQLPNLIADVEADPDAGAMEMTAAAGVGSFASVPLRFSDGRLYGTLCAASHRPRPDLGERDVHFLEVFARIIADQVEFEVLQKAVRAAELQAATSNALALALDARDHYTGLHSLAVVGHVTEVARRLELAEEVSRDIAHVAVLHDIGKIAVPDALLQKRGPLTPEEWEVMKLHPLHGERLVAEIDDLSHLSGAVRAEHERWDGGGYPDGLAEDEIPLASRITFVCDAYHAMRSDRPYRRALSEEDAREELRRGAGAQFCPMAAEALLEVLEESDHDDL